MRGKGLQHYGERNAMPLPKTQPWGHGAEGIRM